MKKISDLSNLLSPASVAVIGATNKPGRVGRIIFERLRHSGLPIYPVNPGETDVLGFKTFPEPASIPENVDLAVVAVGAERAVEAAEQCAQAGIPQIIVVAGGFGESGHEGEVLEERLKAIPQKYKSRILGPNTLGIFLPHKKLNTIFVEHGDKALAAGGGVAFISQSGSVGVEALGLASNTGFGMRAFIGLGNKCDRSSKRIPVF